MPDFLRRAGHRQLFDRFPAILRQAENNVAWCAHGLVDHKRCGLGFARLRRSSTGTRAGFILPTRTLQWLPLPHSAARCEHRHVMSALFVMPTATADERVRARAVSYNHHRGEDDHSTNTELGSPISSDQLLLRLNRCAS